VRSVVILIKDIKMDAKSNIRAPYTAQYELKSNGQGILLCESYDEKCCVWQPSKGRFVLYIPRTQRHERFQEWYMYPAARIFLRPYRMKLNLELHAKLHPVFNASTCKVSCNFLHVTYQMKRQKGIRLPKGMILGYLYVNEIWDKMPSNYDMGPSQYCYRCKKVGHVASECEIGNRRMLK